MSRITLYLHNAQLAQLNPMFAAVRPGYQQRVELIYTEGKADQTLWRGNNNPITKGITPVETTTVRHNPKFLNALIVIDLLKAVRPSRMEFSRMMGRQVMNKATVPEIKQDLFDTILHELQHVLQGWLWAEDWQRIARQAGSAAHGVYKNNRYEFAANRIGNEQSGKKASQLSAGVFDYLFPLQKLKSLA